MRSGSMPGERDPKAMSEEELSEEMEKRYGDDFDFKDLDVDDPFVVEFLDRISRGQ
jgi:hypothetical protein